MCKLPRLETGKDHVTSCSQKSPDPDFRIHCTNTVCVCVCVCTPYIFHFHFSFLFLSFFYSFCSRKRLLERPRLFADLSPIISRNPPAHPNDASRLIFVFPLHSSYICSCAHESATTFESDSLTKKKPSTPMSNFASRGPIPPRGRRSHTKSRNGCFVCKSRRIKVSSP